jgi:hypothetical protein
MLQWLEGNEQTRFHDPLWSLSYELATHPDFAHFKQTMDALAEMCGLEPGPSMRWALVTALTAAQHGGLPDDADNPAWLRCVDTTAGLLWDEWQEARGGRELNALVERWYVRLCAAMPQESDDNAEDVPCAL